MLNPRMHTWPPRIHIGPGGTPLRFTYYLTPTVSQATPNYGSASGSTLVQLAGSHFIDDGRLTCRFGSIEVRAVRFISSNLILCKAPRPVVCTRARAGPEPRARSDGTP